MGEDLPRVNGECGGAADDADHQGGQHAGFEAVTGDIADNNQYASIFRIGNDLKEIASDFLRGAVFALNTQAGRLRQLVRNEKLLHAARRGKFACIAVAFLIMWHTSALTIWHNDCKSRERMCRL